MRDQIFDPNFGSDTRSSYVGCDDGIVHVPLACAGTRKLSKRARGSSRGGIPYYSPLLGKYIELKTESHLEGSALFVAMADPDVIHIWDQPKSIEYKGSDGKPAEYTADARIEYSSGLKVLVETKPSQVVLKDRADLKLRRIAPFIPSDFADEITLFTELSCPRWFVEDARRLHEFSKHPDQEADYAIREAADHFDNEVTLAALAARTGLAGRGFRAAVRAVFRGEIKRMEAKALTPNSRVVVSRAGK